MAEVRKEAGDVGFTTESGTPEEFATFIKAERERWGKVIEQGKIHLKLSISIDKAKPSSSRRATG